MNLPTQCLPTTKRRAGTARQDRGGPAASLTNCSQLSTFRKPRAGDTVGVGWGACCPQWSWSAGLCSISPALGSADELTPLHSWRASPGYRLLLLSLTLQSHGQSPPVQAGPLVFPPNIWLASSQGDMDLELQVLEA